jgi:hypothetical protein
MEKTSGWIGYKTRASWRVHLKRIAVMELCQKAVEEEAGSTKLWVQYGDGCILCILRHTVLRSSTEMGSWKREVIGQRKISWLAERFSVADHDQCL